MTEQYAGKQARTDLLATAVLVSVGLVFVAVNGIPVTASMDSAPAGQVFYRLARMAGLLSAYLLCIQVVAGLANTMGLRRLWPWGRKGHIVLFVGFAVVLVCHIVFFLIGVGLRTGAFPLYLLVPDFTHGYYRTSISIGAAALVGLVVVAFAGWRRLRNTNFAPSLHQLAYLVFVLVIVHSTNIGSETRSYPTLIVLTATALAVIGLWCVRRRTRRARN